MEEQDPPDEGEGRRRIEITTPAQRRKREIQQKLAKRGHAVGKPKKDAEVRSIAQRLLSGKKYQENLQKRLEEGVAGPIEIWLYRYAYGDPEKNTAERERERERFEKMRAQVLDFLKRAPERAHIMDANVQRAPRLLALPSRPEPEIVDLPVRGNGTDRDS